MEPIGLWAFDWLCPKSVIAPLAAATPPVSSNTPSQYCLNTNASGFCNSYFFYGAGSLSLRPTPNLEDQGALFVWSLPYQEYKTPADIALGVIETSKLPHHDEVVTPFGAETGSHYSQ